MPDDRIPTYVWIEAEIRRLSGEGFGVYVTAKGDKMGGLVLQKITDMAGKSRLLVQQRDMGGKLGWANALSDDIVAETEADSYIRRATQRDPDLWVVEIEDRALQNRLAY